jgi:hypothetical protein
MFLTSSISSKLTATLLHAGFLLLLFFDYEDGGEMFLRNIGWLSVNYAAFYPRFI